MHMMGGKARVCGALVFGLLSGGAMTQARTLTPADYARAERFMAYRTTPLVDHAVGRVHWLDDSRFWYRDHDAGGDHIMQMDVATGKAVPAFDQAALAVALGHARDKAVDPAKFPYDFGYGVKAEGRLDVRLGDEHYRCALGAATVCTREQRGKEPGVLSPDKLSQAFIRDWNLWLRDVASGKEIQLTTDGVENFGYATDNAGWKHTDQAILEWSPDSTQIATFQQDQRQTGEMYLLKTQVGHPELLKWKYPLVGDEHVTMIERVIIKVRVRKVVRLKMPPDQHRSSLCDDISCGPEAGWNDVKWAPDGKTLAFVSTSRDHKQEWFRIADAQTGKVHTVFEEVVPTYFESGNGEVNWRYLPQTHEAIWFSERNNWGNLYLYDLDTGKLKHAITTGEGNVTEVLKVDPNTRTVWFRGVGRMPGVDPYYQQFWKVSLDGGSPTLLTPEAADHTISLAPDGEHFVDAYSTPTTPPVTVLRRSDDGRTLATVARADIS
ncbi:MAG: DPP IV N-terminal domain-containing protein, partial [Rhodanobacter sp.]